MNKEQQLKLIEFIDELTSEELEAWKDCQDIAWNLGSYIKETPLDFIYECRLDLPEEKLLLVEKVYNNIKEIIYGY